jgi:hypothetical protein
VLLLFALALVLSDDVFAIWVRACVGAKDAEILDVVMNCVLEKAVSKQPPMRTTTNNAPAASTAPLATLSSLLSSSASAEASASTANALRHELQAHSSEIVSQLIARRYHTVTTHLLRQSMAAAPAPVEVGGPMKGLNAVVAEITHSVDFAIQSTVCLGLLHSHSHSEPGCDQRKPHCR